MFSFALDMAVVGGTSRGKRNLPLNPDLQTLLDCSAQSRTVFRAVLMAVPYVGQGMHAEGLPCSLCHDQLLAQRAAKQCKVIKVWDFSLEQRVLKQ